MILLDIVAFACCVSVPVFEEFTETSFPCVTSWYHICFQIPCAVIHECESIYLILPINEMMKPVYCGFSDHHVEILPLIHNYISIILL
jgi:hypothetical protein